MGLNAVVLMSSLGVTTSSGYDSAYYTGYAIGFFISIIIAIVFNKVIKKNIKNKNYFSGTVWGVLHGIFVGSIIPVVISHNSINKEIEKVKDKKYKKYAELEMKDFVKSYSICVLIEIVIITLLSMPS